MGKDSLFETLFVMIQTILGPISDEEVFKIISRRLNMSDGLDTLQAAALLEMDEAKEVLERSDRDRVEAQQKEIESDAAAHCSLVAEFRQKKQAHVLALAKKSGKHRSSNTPQQSRPPAKLPQTISQQEAKRPLPPGASVWVSNVHEAWCGHLEPFRRCSTPWSLYNSDQLALQDLLCKLWSQHFVKSGETKALVRFRLRRGGAALVPPDEAGDSGGRPFWALF